MSETMTAESERAQQLVSAYGDAERKAGFCDSPEYGAMVDARAALLAYVARLEAVADAARETIATHYGPFGEIRKALAALDRPEDGEQ